MKNKKKNDDGIITNGNVITSVWRSWVFEYPRRQRGGIHAERGAAIAASMVIWTFGGAAAFPFFVFSFPYLYLYTRIYIYKSISFYTPAGVKCDVLASSIQRKATPPSFPGCSWLLPLTDRQRGRDSSIQRNCVCFFLSDSPGQLSKKLKARGERYDIYSRERERETAEKDAGNNWCVVVVVVPCLKYIKAEVRFSIFSTLYIFHA